MKVSYKKTTTLLFSFFFSVLASAEPFRVAELHTISLSDSLQSQEKSLGLNDALAIFLPEDKTFLQGIELKMEIPELTVQWRDCAACTVYQNLTPVPSQGQIDYSGNKLFFGVLPGKLSWILQIPFTKENSLKTNQYTTKIDEIPDLSQNYIFIRLQQIMKGVPDEVMDSRIQITVNPILSDKGKLNLNIIEPENSENQSPFSVFVDDEPFSDNVNNILLKNGVHTVTVMSELYRTEVRTVHIEQAKITELSVKMKSINPTMIITAPDGTSVYLDDEKFVNFGNEFEISEGEHKVKFTIGDYEMLRKISISKGKTYKVNLTVDLQIAEEE